jgi:hypothetical protein
MIRSAIWWTIVFGPFISRALADHSQPAYGRAASATAAFDFGWLDGGQPIEVSSPLAPLGSSIFAADSVRYSGVQIPSGTLQAERVILPQGVTLQITLDPLTIAARDEIQVATDATPVDDRLFNPVTLNGRWTIESSWGTGEQGEFSIPLDLHYQSTDVESYRNTGPNSSIIGYTNQLNAVDQPEDGGFPLWSGNIGGQEFALEYLGARVATTFEAVPCDVARHDYSCDRRDIDALQAATRNGQFHAIYDLHRDGRLDFNDRVAWSHAANTPFGDADLSSHFNSADLVYVLQAGQYEDSIPGNSTWATGDWDGNGEFESSDLVLALATGAYERNATASTVPEPGGGLAFVLSAAWFIHWRRRSR